MRQLQSGLHVHCPFGDARTLVTEREAQRLAALHALQVLDSAAEKAYDDLTCIAARICGTSMALVSLVDTDRQWFKARVGVQESQQPREFAFCAHAIERPLHLMVVADTLNDPRFANNPYVLGAPFVRFYAGAPLVTASGHAVGTLCVLDKAPRHLDAAQLDLLEFLAKQIVTALEAAAGQAPERNTEHAGLAHACG